MTFNFEVFRKRSKPKSSVPTVTIQKRGTFSLNQQAFDALRGAEAVELLYDRHQKVIGMRPANAETQYAYPVRRQANGATWLIAGLAFCEYYNIPLGNARRYVAELYDDGAMLTVDLKKDAIEVAGSRSKKSSQ